MLKMKTGGFRSALISVALIAIVVCQSPFAAAWGDGSHTAINRFAA